MPLVESRALFDAFADAGRELCKIHVGYETVEPCPLTEEWTAGADPETNPDLLLVGDRKMSYANASVSGTGYGARGLDRSRLRYNDYLTLSGIPPEAHEYVLAHARASTGSSTATTSRPTRPRASSTTRTSGASSAASRATSSTSSSASSP